MHGCVIYSFIQNRHFEPDQWRQKIGNSVRIEINFVRKKKTIFFLYLVMTYEYSFVSITEGKGFWNKNDQKTITL